jgi:phosphoenolpyruvate-protein phosphotransferase (PTS system enzyme I)
MSDEKRKIESAETLHSPENYYVNSSSPNSSFLRKRNNKKTFASNPAVITEPFQGETELTGIGVSKGVTAGKIIRLHGTLQIFRITIAETEIEKEIRRFRAAIRLTRQRLKKIKQLAAESVGEKQSYIFEAHLLMLEDRSLLEPVESCIQTEKVNAEWAVKVVSDNILQAYSEIQNEYLQDRRTDIEDVIQRLLLSLSGSKQTTGKIEKEAVLLAEEILPSTLAELSRENIRAIVTEKGGWTSHSFILARELGLPAVSGIKNIFQKVRSGDSIIVDGFNGRIILHPENETLKRYENAIVHTLEARNIWADTNLSTLKTADSRPITIRANLDLAEKYADCQKFGAEGIGLYRSEFLFGKNGRIPTENEQLKAYRQLSELAGKHRVRIRLFDIGSENLAEKDRLNERNPALGLRAIRLGLSQKEILRPQIRAILRLVGNGNLDVVVPMVSDVSEIRRVKIIIQEEAEKLAVPKYQLDTLGIGAMIEVPSAALTAEAMARETDFLSLGTNDLVQYLLAVDRDNEAVESWFRSLHPAVLHCIHHTLKSAKKLNKPITVCGEMAGSPVYAAILVGLGAEDFSMTSASIPRVRRALSQIKQTEAEEIALKLLDCGSADETEEIVRSEFGKRFSHIFPPEMLPSPRLKRALP